MPDLFEKPEDFRPGSRRISAGSLNDILKALPRLITGANGIEVSKAGDRIIIGLKDGGSPIGAENLRYFVIREERDDYLICTPLTRSVADAILYDKDRGKDDPAVVYIAKPYALQRSPWDTKVVKLGDIEYTYQYYGTAGTVGFKEPLALPTGAKPGKRKAIYDDPSGIIDTNTNLVRRLTDELVIDPPYFPGDFLLAFRTGTPYSVLTDVSTDTDSPIVWTDMNQSARRWGLAALGQGLKFLAEVDINSGAGIQPSYLVNIFDGTDYAATQNNYIDKTDPNNPVDTGSPYREKLATANQLPTAQKAFYNGELVVVQQAAQTQQGVGPGPWYIQKLFESQYRDGWLTGQLAMRLFSYTAPPGTSDIVRYINTTSPRRTYYSRDGTSGLDIYDRLASNSFYLFDEAVDYKTMLDHFGLTANQSVNYVSVTAAAFGGLFLGYLFRDCIVPIIESKNASNIVHKFNDKTPSAMDFGTYTIKVDGVLGTAGGIIPPTTTAAQAVWVIGSVSSGGAPNPPSPITVTSFGSDYTLASSDTPFYNGLAYLLPTIGTGAISNLASTKVHKTNFVLAISIHADFFGSIFSHYTKTSGSGPSSFDVIYQYAETTEASVQNFLLDSTAHINGSYTDVLGGRIQVQG